MTPKPTQLGRKLMTFVTALHLLLSAVIAQSSEDASEVKPFAEYDLSLTKAHPMTRTDVIYAHRNIVATKEVWNHLRPTGFWIKLITPDPNSTSSECFQTFHPAAVLSLKRLSYETILFDALPLNISERTKRKPVLLNIKNCSYKSIYDGPVSLDYKIFKSNNASDQSFTLLMNGKPYCRGHNWCRLFFNPVYHKFEPLDFDLPSDAISNIKPATSFDGNLFIVDFLDETKTCKIRLYNVTNHSASSNYKELLSLANCVSFSSGWPQRRYEIISSLLSYCWRTNQDTDEDKYVHCAAFHEDGSVVVNQTIVYSDIIKFFKVQSIPNGLVLIGKRECANEAKCSNVQVTVITNDSCADSHCNSAPQGSGSVTVRHRYYNFKCRPFFVSQMYFRVNVPNDSVEVDHMCIYKHRTDDGSSHVHVLAGE